MHRFLASLFVAIDLIAFGTAHAADVTYTAGFDPHVPSQSVHVATATFADNLLVDVPLDAAYKVTVTSTHRNLGCSGFRCMSPGTLDAQVLTVAVGGVALPFTVLNTGMNEFVGVVYLSAGPTTALVTGQGRGLKAGLNQGDYLFKIAF